MLPVRGERRLLPWGRGKYSGKSNLEFRQKRKILSKLNSFWKRVDTYNIPSHRVKRDRELAGRPEQFHLRRGILRGILSSSTAGIFSVSNLFRFRFEPWLLGIQSWLRSRADITYFSGLSAGIASNNMLRNFRDVVVNLLRIYLLLI